MSKQCEQSSDSECATHIPAIVYSISVATINFKAGLYFVCEVCILRILMSGFFIQVFCFNVSALLHCGGNTVVSALEALHQLLLSVNTELEGWLLTEDPSLQVRKLVSVFLSR